MISAGVSGSGEEGLKLFRFAFMAIPHADDASCDAARRPCEDNKSGIKPPRRDGARLAVVSAIICASEVRPGKNLLRSTHVQAAFLQSPFSFCRITGDSHRLNVATEKHAVNKVEWVGACGQRTFRVRFSIEALDDSTTSRLFMARSISQRMGNRRVAASSTMRKVCRHNADRP